MTFKYTWCTTFSDTDCATDHYLVVAKVREKLSVHKRAAQKFGAKKVNIWKCNNNNNNNNNTLLLQLGCHPVAVVILHVHIIWNLLLLILSQEGYTLEATVSISYLKQVCNPDDSGDINRAWENTTQNIKISAKHSLCQHEQKHGFM